MQERRPGVAPDDAREDRLEVPAADRSAPSPVPAVVHRCPNPGRVPECRHEAEGASWPQQYAHGRRSTFLCQCRHPRRELFDPLLHWVTGELNKLFAKWRMSIESATAPVPAKDNDSRRRRGGRSSKRNWVDVANGCRERPAAGSVLCHCGVRERVQQPDRPGHVRAGPARCDDRSRFVQHVAAGGRACVTRARQDRLRERRYSRASRAGASMRDISLPDVDAQNWSCSTSGRYRARG